MLSTRPDGNRVPILEAVRRCAAAGYRVMDLDLNSGKRSPAFELGRPDWEAWLDDLVALSRECGVEFTQSHAPDFNVADPQLEGRSAAEELVRRAIVVSGRLGVRWMAMHAGTAWDANRFLALSKSRNIDWFGPIAEFAAGHGVGIAIENMQERLAEGRMKPRRRYTAGIEEQCDLIDSLAMDNVGAVWDFGHANITGYDQVQCLEFLGARLKALHVHDNNGLYDDHTLPFLGSIDWPPIMVALRRLGYTGDFSFETAYFTRRMPDALIDAALAWSLQVGQYLLSL
jgi:sugar phosphate isomerase/epimerase